MTTALHVRRILQPLLARHPDLVLVGRYIFVTPVRHVLRGVYVDATSSHTICRPKHEVMFLACPFGVLGTTFGDELFRGRNRLWDFTSPEFQEDLVERIEAELPALRSAETVEGFVAFASGLHDNFSQQPVAMLIADVALGNLDAAAVKAEAMRARQRALEETPWGKKMANAMFTPVIDPLYEPILRHDVTALAALLHAWEAARAERTEGKDLWQPSPFPLERLAS